MGLLEDDFVIHDAEQWPHCFSWEQVVLPGATSLQLLLLPLLGLLLLLLFELGDEDVLEGLFVFDNDVGEDGAGPS